MTKEEIRQKAIECGKAYETMRKSSVSRLNRILFSSEKKGEQT